MSKGLLFGKKLKFTQKNRNFASDFPQLAPAAWLAKIKICDPLDPLLLQILPQKNELKKTAGFKDDPLDEKTASPVSGLIHRYYGRVLLLVTDQCALNCRFCFRRHLRDKVINWSAIFSYIKNDQTISEVILSGGDPLMLPPKKLQFILSGLEKIKHLKRIRIHSRVPVANPDLVKVAILKTKLPLILVIHCNHPNEIDAKVAKKIASIRALGVFVLNQSVLLRKINDHSQVLVKLSEKLFAIGVIPYYLHILDHIQGAAHFMVTIPKAKKIYSQMKRCLPGYLVPKLVVEKGGRKVYL